MKNENPQEGLGMLCLLVFPSIFGIVYSLIYGAPSVKKNLNNWIIYNIVGLVFDPLVYVLLYLLIIVFRPSQKKGSVVLKSILNVFPKLLIKNVFEEYSWRGFLFPFLFSKYSFWISSSITSVVWYFWHFPLWFVFTPREELLKVSTFQNFYLNLLVIPLSLFLMGNIYHFLYLKTYSFILLIVMHTFNNSIVASFFAELCIEDHVLKPALTSPFYLFFLLVFNGYIFFFETL